MGLAGPVSGRFGTPASFLRAACSALSQPSHPALGHGSASVTEPAGTADLRARRGLFLRALTFCAVRQLLGFLTMKQDIPAALLIKGPVQRREVEG